MFDCRLLQLFRQHARLSRDHYKAAHRNRQACLVETDHGMARRYRATYLHHSQRADWHAKIARAIRDGFDVLSYKTTGAVVHAPRGEGIAHA